MLIANKKVSKNWEEDFNAFVPGMIEENEPCYVLYRFVSLFQSGDGLIVFF